MVNLYGVLVVAVKAVAGLIVTDVTQSAMDCRLIVGLVSPLRAIPAKTCGARCGKRDKTRYCVASDSKPEL